MPNSLRRCKQCGEHKPVGENFRTYYHKNSKETKSVYKTCKACEKINQRLKYLSRKDNRSSAEETEIALIKELYELQRLQGLKPPGSDDEALDIAAVIAAQKAKAIPMPAVDEIPHELQHWLSVDLQAFTPEDLEKVSDDLFTKYKTVIGVDSTSLAPVYDDKYRDILNEILKRFDDYEDNYYEES